jgi:nucleotide-binding universal stress UspA family protein
MSRPGIERPGPGTGWETAVGYANILVSVDLDRGSAERVRLAAGLARRFEADLTGMAAWPIPGPSAITNLQEDAILRAAAERRARDAAARTRDLFARQSGEALRTAWRFTEGPPAASLAREARAADLVVVGRQCTDDSADDGPDDGLPGPMAVPPGPLLMAAGRPVLVVPPGLAHLGADRILVAWKDTLEARRAVAAAVPFLRQADHVFLVSVGPEAPFQGPAQGLAQGPAQGLAQGAAQGPAQGLEAVADHLTRHGANVTIHRLGASARGEASELLRFARREYADLLVLGAYGHSRLREWIFGGMTRDVLQTTPICALLCH